MPLSELTESIFEFRRFLRRYARHFRHPAQRHHFEAFLRGLIGPLERKSIEPIAIDQGVPWQQLEDFIGRSTWDSEALIAEHRRHIAQSMGSPRAVVIIDPTSFPKRGNLSVGVTRQWCGQLGKEENCVVGVNLAYASERGHTFLDRRMYLPKEWAGDLRRRVAAGVPNDVVFRTSGELAYEMIAKARRDGLQHAWITGDEEFGKLPWLQDWLHQDAERYILEVPCSTRVWLTLPKRRIRGPIGLSRRLRVRGPGRPRLVRVDALIRELPQRIWIHHDVRDGSKGPIRVRAALLRVMTHRRKGTARREEWLLITHTLDQHVQTKYFLSNAAADAPIEELLRAGFARWPVEQCHGQGKNETGLGDYETRSWLGWHRHTALSFLAHHWLTLERNRLGEKIPRDDGRRSPARLLRGFTDGALAPAQAEPPDATSATAQSFRTAVALEEGLGSTGNAGASQAGSSRTRQVNHRSHAKVVSRQYQ
jgi:SRSO17 transposase